MCIYPGDYACNHSMLRCMMSDVLKHPGVISLIYYVYDKGKVLFEYLSTVNNFKLSHNVT